MNLWTLYIFKNRKSIFAYRSPSEVLYGKLLVFIGGQKYGTQTIFPKFEFNNDVRTMLIIIYNLIYANIYFKTIKVTYWSML